MDQNKKSKNELDEFIQYPSIFGKKESKRRYRDRKINESYFQHERERERETLINSPATR